MPKANRELTKTFERQLRVLDKTRGQIEKLYQNRLVNRQLVEQTYAGLFITAYTGFESFLEELFIGLLVDSRGYTQIGVKPRIIVKTHEIARELVFGGRNYADWLPYDQHTKKRAGMFFSGGRPFSDLDNSAILLLKQSSYVRNVIAHQSSHSITQFLKNVVQNQSLSPREKKPFGYLRALHAGPNQTKYEYHINTLLFVARQLAP